MLPNFWGCQCNTVHLKFDNEPLNKIIMKRLVKLVRVLTVLVIFAFSLSVYFAFAAGGATKLCGETSLNEAIWEQTSSPCVNHSGVTVMECFKTGSESSCKEYCCSTCGYPGIQPE